MALNAVVTVESIERRAEGGTLTLRLKVFAGAANPDVDDPLFEDTASATIKGNVEGETRQQLVNRATQEAGEQLRDSALAYQRVVEYMGMVQTAAVETAIEDALGGA